VFLEQIKTEYQNASHHCYGYRIDPVSLIEFSSDDGEPSGTAGLPILNQLKSFEVVNAGIVVVRYFGGSKLGKPGLIQAYGETAKLCLEKTSLKEINHVQLFRIEYPYTFENLINKMVLNHELSEQDSQYFEQVTKIFACPVKKSTDFEQELESLAHLPITYQMLYKSYISID
tara:strand:+ start:80178 stop:80696 length:519 start_codon:yes stop_codon:yes gene_type:complete